jgi:C4-dicarboxylate-specific signal transduction histidine kinase
MAMMGEMMGAIAHQWRQPLNTLGLLIQDVPEAFRYGEFDQDYAIKFSQNAMNTINKMSKTIDDFKNFFKPQKEAIHFSIEDAVDETLSLLLPQLKSFNIDVQFVNTTLHKIFGHKNELKQVIFILLSNANDALVLRKTPNPTITISIARDKEMYVLKIEDNAGGVPHEIIDRIFEPYFTTKHQAQGTGIGLYMAKEIIERTMQGSIYVTNTANGACFAIDLPQSS